MKKKISLVIILFLSMILNPFRVEIKAASDVEDGHVDTTGYNPYDEIINLYITGINEEWDVPQYDNKGISFIFAGHLNQLEDIGYFLIDLNGDGVEELLMGSNAYTTDPDFYNMIFALYTIDNDNWIQLSNWRYACFYLCTNNSLAIKSENEQYTDWGYYTVNDSKLKLKERIIYEKNNGNGKWYYSNTDNWGLDNATLISEENASQIRENYEFVPISFIPLSNFENEENNSKPDNMLKYAPVLDQYQKAMANRFYADDIFSIGDDINASYEFLQSKGKYLELSVVENAIRCSNYRPAVCSGGEDGLYHLYYCFSDLNNDGTDEMVLGGSRDSDPVNIYNIFAYDGNNSVPVFEVNSIGWREGLYIHDNNDLLWVDSKGAVYVLYHLPTGSVIPEKTESYEINWENKTVNHCDSGGNILETLSYDEFNVMKESYIEKSFNWIELKDKEQIDETGMEDSPLKQRALAEVQDVQNYVSELENSLKTESMSQAEMNQYSGQIFQAWDDELNILWGYLKETLPAEEMEILKQEELEWISYKEGEVNNAGKEFEGGSMRPMVETTKAAELTKKRVYELLDKLP